MAESQKTKANLLTQYADNVSRDISAQDLRDFVETMNPGYGSMFLSSPGSETIILDSLLYYKCLGTTTDVSLNRFEGKTLLAVDNHLKYTGTALVHIHGACTISFSIASGNNKLLEFDIYHYDASAGTGALVGNSMVSVNASSTAIQSTALHFDFMMDTNDYIELHVRNTADTTNVTLENMYMFLLTMMT